MSAEKLELLAGVFAKTLERSAYMFADPAGKDLVSPPLEDCFEASISFTGPMRGAVSLIMPESLCAEAAAGALGTEPGDKFAGGHGRDAAGELVNMVCGQFLTACAGESAVFQLSSPAVKTIAPGQWGGFLVSGNSAVMTVDDKPVIILLQWADTD
jgi:hypothetical protein